MDAIVPRPSKLREIAKLGYRLNYHHALHYLKKNMARKIIFRLVLCVLTICGSTTQGESRQVTVAIPGVLNAIAFQIAQDKGYYRQEGLEAQLIVMQATVANQALLGGNVDVASAAGSSLLAIIAGAPLRFIFTTFDRPFYFLLSREDVREIKELKGKKVAFGGGIGSGFDTNLRVILDKHGIEPARDVLMLGMAHTQIVYGALASGSVDAAVLTVDFAIKAREAGFRQLASFSDQALGLVQPQGSMIVTQRLLQTEPIVVEKFVRGTLKGLLYARGNRSGSISILSRRNGISQERGAKTADYIFPAMTVDGTMSEEAQRTTLNQFLGRLGKKESPALGSVFDFSIVRKMHAELKAQGWRPELD
jgi:ABC-type nitrate/sulfonate/bicarbonate transport system substrate-binding protein